MVHAGPCRAVAKGQDRCVEARPCTYRSLSLLVGFPPRWLQNNEDLTPGISSASGMSWGTGFVPSNLAFLAFAAFRGCRKCVHRWGCKIKHNSACCVQALCTQSPTLGAEFSLWPEKNVSVCLQRNTESATLCQDTHAEHQGFGMRKKPSTVFKEAQTNMKAFSMVRK